MNIKEVSEKTGLTKKAIRYYEDAGIIQIPKNPANQYRDYDNHDVQKLKAVALLRDLDFSISQIRSIMNGNTSILEELQKQEYKFEEDLIELQKKQFIIRSLKGKITIDDTINDLINMVEHESLEDPRLIIKIKKVFPGIFGEFLSISLSPFIEVIINTGEERNLVNRLITILDNIPDIPESHPIVQYIINENTVAIEQFKESNLAFYNGILQDDATTIENLKTKIISQVKQMQNDDVFRNMVSLQLQQSKDLPNLTIDSPFSNILEGLSDKYKMLVEKLKKIDMDINNELGFNYKDYLMRV